MKITPAEIKCNPVSVKKENKRDDTKIMLPPKPCSLSLAQIINFQRKKDGRESDNSNTNHDYVKNSIV